MPSPEIPRGVYHRAALCADPLARISTSPREERGEVRETTPPPRVPRRPALRAPAKPDRTDASTEALNNKTEGRTMKSLAAVLAAGIALAASAGAANAQHSDDVVKIAVLTDMYADASGKGSLAAVQMAVADYGGKVKGKPVEVIAADHQNKPDVGVNIARNWYDNEKVDAIFDLPTSS